LKRNRASSSGGKLEEALIVTTVKEPEAGRDPVATHPIAEELFKVVVVFG